mmetsp:Transcript_33653/g.41229  ORF Transcript_33653/g.41229 Transcript_33653/m.41229 type:complete len:256 (-) Transcript_33653:153-920(-)|eukprot:CAMPEP_0172508312 /NCGR_PEP_ID=MMETSP1066-20121228/210925_1 /TAXON_ID=671091 /ORGANISM="Coscinodiscus wailesii, Strain CCMP2513" /LENGTH=255 /DNA_ID=CAMNT_0013286233 /DNA_START=66 /DNA_END=833 /DNA_ORIENTATION=-
MTRWNDAASMALTTLLFSLIPLLHPSTLVRAYTPRTHPLHPPPRTKSLTTPRLPPNQITSFAAAITILATTPFLPPSALAADTPTPSQTAARIHLDSIPPTTVQVQIADLPVLGDLLSGTYARLNTGAADAVGKALGGGAPPKPASVTVRSPVDKVSAIRNLATKGHLEFDIDGLLETHLDVDVRTPKAGELTVRISSPIIPQLPYKEENLGSGIAVAGGKMKSDWAAVTNMGDGSVSYYLNVKTGETQLQKPMM